MRHVEAGAPLEMREDVPSEARLDHDAVDAVVCIQTSTDTEDGEESGDARNGENDERRGRVEICE